MIKDIFKKTMMMSAIVAATQFTNAYAMIEFDVEDVIAHANTYPQNYGMKYLQSEEGKSRVDSVIKGVNNGKLGTGYKDPLCGWNHTDHNCGYNKSLIAHYVSTKGPTDWNPFWEK